MRDTVEQAINKAAGENPELKNFVEEFRTKQAAKHRPMKPVDRPVLSEMEFAQYRIQYAQTKGLKLSSVTDEDVYDWLESISLSEFLNGTKENISAHDEEPYQVFDGSNKLSLNGWLLSRSKDNTCTHDAVNELTPRNPINRLVQEKVLENNRNRNYGQSQKELYTTEEQISFVRTRDVNIPRKQHVTDAAWDLYIPKDFKPRHIEPGERLLIPLGIVLNLPVGYMAKILPRSGNAMKHGIGIVNSIGLIDSGYRGEIGAIVINMSKQSFYLCPDLRIAQMTIEKIEPVRLVESGIIQDDTDRGTGGYGHTGL